MTVHRPGHRPPDDPRIAQGFQPMRWDLKPPQFKTYSEGERIELPESIDAGAELDVRAIGRLLFLSGGVVRVMDGVMGGRMWFRAAGSAGNLSPLELYLVTATLPGLDAGVYHYEPVEHALTRLAGVDVATPPALVITGVQWRTSWKYRERGFRHLWWDAGTMLAQTLAVTEEGGWDARVEIGFVDAEVSALLGLDADQERPLVVVALAGAAALSASPIEAPVTGHLADGVVEFPLAVEAARAGDLDDAELVDEWRKAALAGNFRPAPRSDRYELGAPVQTAIRRRGSTREFDIRDIAPAAVLNEAMGWATRAVPADFLPAGGTLVENFLVVHAVDGIVSGSYRWTAGGLEPLVEGDLRAVSAHLCLDQPLGGTGAYTVFHCADLEAVTRALGDRGYRAALVEAGIVEGRLHLAAFARGYGATGLTFYDDEVKLFFDTAADPVLVTAVGKPTYRSRPGGLPRHPVVMRGA